MGRKAVLVLLCWLAVVKAEVQKAVNSSVMSDNVSAESAPQLYHGGFKVYASGAPYTLTFRAPDPSMAASHVVPVKEESVFIQNQNGFLKDSYGNQYKVGSPQAVAYRTTFPQQYVRLQDLPVHLSQPLIPGFNFNGNGPQFSYTAPTFRFSTLTVTPTPIVQSQSPSHGYAENIRGVSPAQGRYFIPHASPQQQPSNSKAVYASQHNPGQYNLHQGPKFQRLEELKPHGFQISQGSGVLHNNKVIHSNKENLQKALQAGLQGAPAKQVTVTTYNNGKKATVTLETQPTLPLLDLNLLQPLHFDNPIVPQVQHFLPKINYPIPQVEQKKHHNEFVVQKTKSYDSGYVPQSDNEDDGEGGGSEEEEETPPPPQQKPNVTQKPHHNLKPSTNSYEINSPNYKETYNEQVVKYDKKTDSEPVHYSYNKQTENKPVTYSYSKTSKAPVIDKHLSYEVHGRGPKQQIIVHSTPESKPHHHEEEHDHQHHTQSHHQSGYHHPQGDHEGHHHHSQGSDEGEHHPQHHHQEERHHHYPQSKHHEDKHHHQDDHYHPQSNHYHHPQSSRQEASHHHHPQSVPRRESEASGESESEESEEQSPRNNSGEEERDDEKTPSHQLKAEHRQHHTPQHNVPRHSAPHHNLPQHSSNYGPRHRAPQHDSPQHSAPHHNTPHHNVPQHIISNVQNQYGILHSSPPPQFQPIKLPVTTIQNITPDDYEENIRIVPTDHPNGQIKVDPHHPQNVPYIENNQQHQNNNDGYNSQIQVHPQNLHSSPAPQGHYTTHQAPIQHVSPPPQRQYQSTRAPQHEHHQSPSPSPQSYYGTSPHVIEKTRKIIIQEESPDEMHMHREQMVAEMINQGNEENEEDFEKAYKEAAFGFPAYERNTEQLEKDIYNPESYGAPQYKEEDDFEHSPFEQYQEEGDAFPKSARLSYKDDKDNLKEDYFLDYSVSKPESYIDKHTNKVNYYKMFKKQKPKYYYGDAPETKQKKSEKLMADLFGHNSYHKPKQIDYFAQLKQAPKFEYNYAKEVPRDSFAFASKGHRKSKTLFVEPQFQYGFEPISLPSLLDSELSAMASNDRPESEKPGTRKKIYQETFHIKKTSTGSEPTS